MKDTNGSIEANSPWLRTWRIFRQDWLAMSGLCGIVFMVSVAIFAPFLANGRPFLLKTQSGLSFPFLRYFFAPDSSEKMVEILFNYVLLLLLVLPVLWLVRRLLKVPVGYVLLGLAALLIIPFLCFQRRLDKTNWRDVTADLQEGEFAVFAPVPYGPFENVGRPYEKVSTEHWCGCDQIGRDVLSRIIHGARVSLAVGLLATGISLVIGVSVGLLAGYLGGKMDMAVMRVVEIVICFPTFLLLLILMAILIDNKYQQSILLVIGVIGLTGWTGLCRLVRGEVLKQRVLPYIKSCEAMGLPIWRILLFHLLPNVSGPILVSFSFGVAGAVLAESSLSFLGFGVQDPTASWGELSRQAFANPFSYWNLTLWPGVLIFLTVCSFNFAGEGLRRVLDPKS